MLLSGLVPCRYCQWTVGGRRHSVASFTTLILLPHAISNYYVIFGILCKHKTRGGSLDISFRLLAILPMFQSDALAFFRHEESQCIRLKRWKDCYQSKLVSRGPLLVSCLNQLRNPIFIVRISILETICSLEPQLLQPSPPL